MTIEESEKKFYFFLRGTCGSFYSSLFKAIMKADAENLEKLKLGFPNEVEVVIKYQREPNYGQSLDIRMERISEYGC